MDKFKVLDDGIKQAIKEEVKDTPYALVSPDIGEKEIMVDSVTIAMPIWLWKLIYRAATHRGTTPDEIISCAFAEFMPVLLDSWKLPELTTLQ